MINNSQELRAKSLFMDFTPATYKHLIETLKLQGFSFITLDAYFRGQLPAEPFVMLRHDVETRYLNALRLAEIEHQMGIRGTYYFRIMNGALNRPIIEKIAALGHEIGYHYDDLSYCRGNHQQAIKRFEKHLAMLRTIAPVTTICMEGAPLSRYDNRDLWSANAASRVVIPSEARDLLEVLPDRKHYNYRDYNIIGEPYFDVDFTRVLYLTDTGRRWDGDHVSVRDKTTQTYEITASRGEKFFAPTRCRSTNHIIAAARANRLPNHIMLTIHPQRWTDKPLPWLQELLWQNVKNVAKRVLVAWR